MIPSTVYIDRKTKNPQVGQEQTGFPHISNNWTAYIGFIENNFFPVIILKYFTITSNTAVFNTKTCMKCNNVHFWRKIKPNSNFNRNKKNRL